MNLNISRSDLKYLCYVSFNINFSSDHFTVYEMVHSPPLSKLLALVMNEVRNFSSVHNYAEPVTGKVNDDTSINWGK